MNAEKPVIDSQPQGTTVNVGGTATLSVSASGGALLSYQWYNNSTNSTVGGSAIPGATSATYAAPTGTAGTTYYYVVVTNTDSSAPGSKIATETSNIVPVTVESTDTEPDAIEITQSSLDISLAPHETKHYYLMAKTSDLLRMYGVIQGESSDNDISAYFESEDGISVSSESSGNILDIDLTLFADSFSFQPGSRYDITLINNTGEPRTMVFNLESYEISASPASGADSSTIRVQVTGFDGSPVGGKSFSLEADGGESVITPEVGATDEHGKIIFMVTDDVTETVNYSLKDPDRNQYYTLPISVDFVAAAMHDVTYDAGAHGTISSNSETVNNGDHPSAIPTVTADAGYKFVGWSSDGGTTLLSAEDISATTVTAPITYTAYYTPIAYSIMFDTDGGSTVSSQTVAYGGKVMMPGTDPTKTGYMFGGWYADAAHTAAFDFDSAITGNTTIYAKWTANNYVLMFDSGGGSTVSSQTVAYGGKATKPDTDPTKTGYMFGGWYADAALTAAYDFDSTITNDITIFAKWIANNYAVTFNTDGGSTVDGQRVAYGDKVTKPNTDPTKMGYTFGGWYADAAHTTAYNFDSMITDDTKIYAKWTLNQYSLTYVAGSHGSIYGQASQTVAYGESGSEVTAVPESGYHFVKWSDGKTSATRTDADVAANLSVTAAFAQDSVPVQPAPAPTKPSEEPPAGGVDILVNGKVENAGTATTTISNNQTVTTVIIDQKKLEDKLAFEDQGAKVTIPVNWKSDVVVSELNGQMVKNLENKQAVLEIETDSATYSLPAQLIDINSMSGQLGTAISLQDIKVKIEIASSTVDTVKVVENAAEKGTFTLVTSPVEFSVKGTYGDKTVEVSKFNAYVERTIAIPDGIDPSKITTGVVVDPDSTVRHVPTKVMEIDGKYYAVINSLTNSTYSVIWHPVEYVDVANHWAKDAVNDMGSRMVVEGLGDNLFNPDRDITRAEFVAIVVRGLGLKLETGVAPFSDVKASAWYNAAIQTASQYKLINGMEDGSFHPSDKITREQAMTIMAKAMEITGLQEKLKLSSGDNQSLNGFLDASEVGAWAQIGAENCLQAGIVTGRNDKQLAPKANITRAEVAVIVERLLRKSNLI